jgi:hypothetical protein
VVHGVERADPVGRDAERIGQGRRRHDADPEPGERTGPEADDHRVQLLRPGDQLAQHRVDAGGQQLPVPAGVDDPPLRLATPGRRVALEQVDERHADRGAGGVEGQDEHQPALA